MRIDRSSTRFSAKAVVVGTLALASITTALPSFAQEASVEVGPSLFSHLMNQVNTLTQRIQDNTKYAQDAMRWQQTWQHYTQQIARFMGNVSNPSMNGGVAFTSLAPDYGVAEKCGGTGGFNFSLQSLARAVIPDANGDIRKSQQQICAQIQMLENAKHNAVVDYSKRVVPTLQKDLDELTRRRAVDGSQGSLQAVEEAAARLEVQQNQSEALLKTQMDNYDTMIAALTRMQQVLAQQALKGKNPVIGAVVKTAALKAALSVGN